MFYLFHHMPKCGGTSFNVFLRSLFTVHADYVGADHLQQPQVFEAFKQAPLALDGLHRTDCLVGHYNLAGIHLSERYPDLEQRQHRKFSILREPFEAASSGIRYGMEQGWIPADLSPAEQQKMLLKRANYFARTFGVTTKDEVRALFERYWFIAPLDRMEHVMRILEAETGKQGIRPQVLNTTARPATDAPPQGFVESFREQSDLDYLLYDLAQLRFGRFSARHLDPVTPA